MATCIAPESITVSTALTTVPRTMSLTIPDLSTSTTFVTSAVDGFGTCVASISTPIASVTTVVTDQTTAATSFITTAAASWPSQVFSVGMLLAGALLLLYGYKMVRPVNFVAGCYLGGTLSLLLLNIFAPTLTSCAAIVATGAASGLLLGFLCALKRASMLTLLGLVAGEILGDVAYKTFLLPLGAPEYAAFFCIGFFAVLLAVLVGQVGDFSVKLVCSFFGAYLVLTNSLKLAAPYVPSPYGDGLLAFNAFKPELSNALAKSTYTTLIGSPYVYGPAIALALLTALGTYIQVKSLKADESLESLIRK